MNLYAYVGNDPLSFRDPTGMSIIEIFVDAKPIPPLEIPWDISLGQFMFRACALSALSIALHPTPVGDGTLTGACAAGDIIACDIVKMNEGKSQEAKGKKGKFWGKLKPHRQGVKTNEEKGRKKRYYEWDYTHGDVEEYDSKGDHLGSRAHETGEQTNPPCPGRDIKDKL